MVLSSVTSAWTLLVTLLSRCVATSSAGPASTSGWRLGQTGKSVLFARRVSAKIKLSLCMVEAIQMEKILGIKFRLDLRVKEVSRPPVTHFLASGLEEAREADFICLLA